MEMARRTRTDSRTATFERVAAARVREKCVIDVWAKVPTGRQVVK
jgi:hypothetical protein